MKIRIKELKKIEKALPLIWDVFYEFEAVNYPDSGKQAFWNAIHAEEYIQTLHAYGAYDDRKLIGIIATRNEGKHIALFFVDGNYHRKGVGSKLWNAVLRNNIFTEITVHSSVYAVEVYKKLGFEQMGHICESDGIQYVPMKYKMIIREDCPCKKVKCFRHDHCNECRARHSDSKSPCFCER